jgi:FKBP-type peptidyl-prolyl cis-trans isomerase (trigger factor)
LVLRKLARDEEIDIEPEELQAEIDTMISDSGESQSAIRQALSSESALDSFRSSLLSRKVMQRLVEIIEGRSGSAEPSDDDESGGTDQVESDSTESDPSEPSQTEEEVAAVADEEPEPEAD